MEFNTESHQSVNTEFFFTHIVPILLAEEREFAVAPNRQGPNICVAGGTQTIFRVRKLMRTMKEESIDCKFYPQPIDCTGLESGEFDDAVHDEKAAEASAINNCGVEDQVEYLVERLGREEATKLVAIRKAKKRS